MAPSSACGATMRREVGLLAFAVALALVSSIALQLCARLLLIALVVMMVAACC